MTLFIEKTITQKTLALSLIACIVISLNGCAINSELVDSNTHQFTQQYPQIERGKKRPVVDTVGWVIGIPRKVLLWNSKVDNHAISPYTEQQVANYLIDNNMNQTKVRLNQYDPIDDWQRLTNNHKVGAGYRYTFGVLHTLGDTFLPGRILGGDSYNPYSDTVHVYSDLPAMATVETARAKDIRSRVHPGTYAFVNSIPGLNLWNETNATQDVLNYTHATGTLADQKEAYQILYPRYGMKTGNAVSSYVPTSSLGAAFEVLGAVTGHVAAYQQTNQLEQETPRSTVQLSSYEKPTSNQ